MSLPTMGELRSVKIGAKTRCTFKVTGKDTQGHFGLFEYAMALAPKARVPTCTTHEELVELMRKFDQYRVPGPSPA